MANCALINLAANIVENIIVADPATDPVSEGYLLVADFPAHIGIGSKWLGDKFEDPPPPQKPPEMIDGLEML